MNEQQQLSKEHGGVCGAGSDPEHAPDMTAIRKDYRWTPACQRAFLEELACTGSVTRATRHVGKSARSAYGLRYRREGAAFRLGWDAAILIARAALADMLMDRAVCGFEEFTSRDEDGMVTRSKYDNRLSMSVLTRLDRMAEAQAAQNSMMAQVQLISQDFENFLGLIERGGQGAETALFLAARDAGIGGSVGTDEDSDIHCELARISADEDDEFAPENDDPEAIAAQLSVWFDEDDEDWKTNFPPRDDHDAAMVNERGVFGDPDYERTLTMGEVVAQLAVAEAEAAPLRDAALKAREAWFDLRQAA
jgi:hypothetical protein